jgi:hypothetical protein
MYYQFINYKYVTNNYSRMLLDRLGQSLDTYAVQYLPSSMLDVYRKIRIFFYQRAVPAVPAAATTTTTN